MEMLKDGRIILRRIMVVFICSGLLLGSSGTVMGQDKCLEKVKEYQDKLDKLMRVNKKYVKEVIRVAKIMSKSAKKIAPVVKDIDKFMKDEKLSQKEATKLSKMSEKVKIVEAGSRKIKELSKGVLKASWAVQELQREMEFACGEGS